MGHRGGGGPVAGEQRRDGQQATRIRVGAEHVAASGGAERRERVAGKQGEQAASPAPEVGRRHLAQEAKVALAAAAGIGPFLHGPARRAADGLPVGDAHGKGASIRSSPRGIASLAVGARSGTRSGAGSSGPVSNLWALARGTHATSVAVEETLFPGL